MKLMELMAREKLNMPDNWFQGSWEVIGDHKEPGGVLIEGVCCPLLTKGENKGRPNWRKADESTRRRTIITPDDYKIWAEQWSQKTGLCNECTGDGRVFQGWNHLSGTTYRVCPICTGTGSHTDRENKKNLVLFVPKGFKESEIVPLELELSA